MSRILKMTAANVLRINAVQITPKGNTVVLTGKNAQGKTSVLLSIIAALGGSKNRPDKLLREGKEKGEIVLTIGDTDPELIVKLKVRAGEEELIVTTPQGAKYQSAQSILDGLKGAIGFEPMTFLRMKPGDQAAMLQKLVGLNFTEIDQKRQELYDERTHVNREVKEAETIYGTMPHHADAPEAEVAVADLAEQLQAANAVNTKNAEARKTVETMKEQGKTLAQELKEDVHEMNEMEAALSRKRKAIEEKSVRLGKLRSDYEINNTSAKSLTDQPTDAIQAQIATAEATNRKVRANASHRAWSAQMDEKRNESARLTGEIETIDADKERQLQEAKMPVKGLAFNANGVLYKGVPLEQASGAESLIVAMAMGAALNPKLRVLLFRDASLLDASSRQAVERYCEQHDLQAWLEVVESDEQGAIVIEDGTVKGAA